MPFVVPKRGEVYFRLDCVLIEHIPSALSPRVSIVWRSGQTTARTYLPATKDLADVANGEGMREGLEDFVNVVRPHLDDEQWRKVQWILMGGQ